MESNRCNYCKYEYGNEPLISIHPLIDMKDGIGDDIKLFATTVSIDFGVGADDEDEANIMCQMELGTDKSIFEWTRIKYCPMCGRKL